MLKNINLTIKKGERVGFVGVTGSGKSTLLDIVMGLLSPTKGKLIVDDQGIGNDNKIAWQRRISHVPQNIYLSDGTLEENIAFGVDRDKIDRNLINKAVKQAKISELIKAWKNEYQTIVGERGVRLSGGQRQRIGIARALYKNTDILILDEATSSLDSKTEQDIMQEIESLNKNYTIFIIAHRLSTLESCNRIIEVREDGTIKTVKG